MVSLLGLSCVWRKEIHVYVWHVLLGILSLLMMVSPLGMTYLQVCICAMNAIAKRHFSV